MGWHWEVVESAPDTYGEVSDSCAPSDVVKVELVKVELVKVELVKAEVGLVKNSGILSVGTVRLS